MHPVEAVQHRTGRVVPHPHRAVLVNRRPRRVVLVGRRRHHLGPRGVQDLVGHLVHVAHHAHLVVAERHVDVHQRHPVAVGARLVDGHPVVGARQDLAVGVQGGKGRVALADAALEARPELKTGQQLGHVHPRRLAPVAPELDAEAAHVVEPGQPVVETRDVDVPAADAVVVRVALAEELRQEAEAVKPDLLAVVATELVVPVPEPGGMPPRPRVEEDARRVHRRGGHDHRPRTHHPFGPALALEVLDPVGAAVFAGQHPRRHRPRDDLQPPRLEGRHQQVVGRVEEGRGAAPRPARPAVVAGGPPPVGLRQHGAADGHGGDAEPSGRPRQDDLGAPRPHRRQMVAAARQGIGVVAAAGHADELLNAVVVGRDVRVADGPGNAPSLPLRAGEVEVGHAEADAPPDVGLAAPSPGAPELEGTPLRGEVRLLAVVESVAGGRLALPAAPVRLERQDMRPRLRPVELPARVEHEHADAVPHEGVGGHGPRRAAADDHDVVHRPPLQNLHAPRPANRRRGSLPPARLPTPQVA